MAVSKPKITVENVNVPGYLVTVDAAMYEAMKEALQQALPLQGPGLTQKEMQLAVLPYLPADLYPGGAKAMWWCKCVQLDLEAKGLMKRTQSKPLRWHQ